MQKSLLLSEAILERFEVDGEKKFTNCNSFSELWDILLGAAEDGNAGKIVCLLNAIGECEDNEGLSSPKHHANYTSGTRRDFNLRFLLTGRPYGGIRRG